jgi:tetratricopeptide (TPR) repeat protein
MSQDSSMTMASTITRPLAAAVAVSLALAMGACGGASRWMVDLRTSQGDAALKSGNVAEALGEYELALRLDSKNARARAGLATALSLRAKAEFTDSKLDAAGADIAQALAYAPSDSVAQALSTQIEQATIRREVVLANYPLYETMGASITDGLKTIVSANKQIAKELKAFRADYDTGHLTKAIVDSYNLEFEARRSTQRLISYRALVQSGAENRTEAAQTQAPELLPIP